MRGKKEEKGKRQENLCKENILQRERMMEREEVSKVAGEPKEEKRGPEGRRHIALDVNITDLMNREALKSNVCPVSGGVEMNRDAGKL